MANPNPPPPPQPVVRNLEVPPPPPHLIAPICGYRPPFGAYGTTLLRLTIPSVPASSAAGEYPDVENPIIGVMSGTAYMNTIRLYSITFCVNNKRTLSSIMQGQPARPQTAQNLSKIFGLRFGASKQTISITW
jgi:hypothetical protein